MLYPTKCFGQQRPETIKQRMNNSIYSQSEQRHIFFMAAGIRCFLRRPFHHHMGSTPSNVIF